MRVDIRNPQIDDYEWMEGQVLSIDKRSKFAFVTISTSFGPEYDVKMIWPGEDIAFCGERIKDRVCDVASTLASSEEESGKREAQ